LSIQGLPPKAKLLSVRLKDSQATLTPLTTDAKYQLDFVAPWRCSITNPREEIKIEVRYQLKGKTFTEMLSVDERCVMGDVWDPSAQNLADIAYRYLQDPMIQRLLERASSRPRGTVEQEAQRLKKMIGFNSETGSLVPDPLATGEGIAHGDYYALSPTETYRYGGDCEDWTILEGAYFYGRGFSTSVDLRVGHVWPAIDGVIQDWVGGGKESDVEETAIVGPPKSKE
jgi:hypothetical protein